MNCNDSSGVSRGREGGGDRTSLLKGKRKTYSATNRRGRFKKQEWGTQAALAESM